MARLHFVVRVARGERVRDLRPRRRGRPGARAGRGDPDLGRGRRRGGPCRGGRGVRCAADRLVRQGFPRGLQGGLPRRGWRSPTSAGSRRCDGPEDIELSTSTRSLGPPPEERRFKLYTRGALSLTPILPLFTHLGVEVIDERPYELTRSDGAAVFVYDFGLRTRPSADWGAGAQREARRTLFQDAVRAVWSGQAESRRVQRPGARRPG